MKPPYYPDSHSLRDCPNGLIGMTGAFRTAEHSLWVRLGWQGLAPRGQR
jgi:hypothetical protein